MIVLWALQNARTSSPAPAPSSPSSPRPRLSIPGVDVYQEPSDQLLTHPPTFLDADDLLWKRYAFETQREGPQPQWVEEPPATRKLTAFERWALEPYLPLQAFMFDTLTIHNGKWPVGWKPPEPGLVAFTDTNREIWIPGDPKPLWQRWWLAALSHELVHVVQMQMGMTNEQVLEARSKHGYFDSPIEVAARATQRRVLRALTMRARSFYADRKMQ